ncbi:MAG: hypothetical protein ABR515_08690, partial [Nitrososphaeraceae archaeon]
MVGRKVERKTMNMNKRSTSLRAPNGHGIDTTTGDDMHHNIPSSTGNDEIIENVLILQGGGSLGAFGCGV